MHAFISITNIMSYNPINLILTINKLTRLNCGLEKEFRYNSHFKGDKVSNLGNCSF